MRAKDRDYSMLEGKVIDYITWSGKKCRGLVIGCDYDIGITIVDVENKDHYLCCIHGPKDPWYNKTYPGQHHTRLHKAGFFSTVRWIKKGKVDEKMIQKIIVACGYVGTMAEASSERCPFNQ